MVPAPTDVALNPATILLNFIFIPQCADHTSLHFFIQLLSGVLLSPLSFSGSLGRDRIWLMLVSPFAVPHQSLVLRQLVRGWKLQPTFSFCRRLTIRNLEPADVISWSLLFWRMSMEKELVPLHLRPGRKPKGAAVSTLPDTTSRDAFISLWQISGWLLAHLKKCAVVPWMDVTLHGIKECPLIKKGKDLANHFILLAINVLKHKSQFF